MSQPITIDGVPLRLSHPVTFDIDWVGREELKMQLLAAWMVVEKGDIPLNPRLIGKPGVGKTTLAYGAARSLGKEVFLFQATMDTRPEDLLVTPVVGEDQTIRYVASSLVTAMLRGGVCILDEGNRMSEKSWASLAPLLDNRRYVESIIAGIKIHAHPEFRFVATMNDDASTFDLPEYIHSRLQPQIFIDFPDKEEEEAIIKQNLPFCDREVLEYVTNFLQRAHAQNEKYTVRDGINVARYALKLRKANSASGGRKTWLKGKLGAGGGRGMQELTQAVQLILGEEALPYLPGKHVVDSTRTRSAGSSVRRTSAEAGETGATGEDLGDGELNIESLTGGLSIQDILRGRLERDTKGTEDGDESGPDEKL